MQESIETITKLYELTAQLFEHDLYYEFEEALELVPQIQDLLNKYVESLK